jgi:sugar phosphate permease
MIGLALAILALFFVPGDMFWLQMVISGSMGFFASGPQTMVSVAAVDLASKRAAGAASGLTGVFGYIGTGLAGWGLAVVSKYGWGYVIIVMFASAILGALCFLYAWNARARSFDVTVKKTESISKKEAA